MIFTVLLIEFGNEALFHTSFHIHSLSENNWTGLDWGTVLCGIEIQATPFMSLTHFCTLHYYTCYYHVDNEKFQDNHFLVIITLATHIFVIIFCYCVITVGFINTS